MDSGIFPYTKTVPYRFLMVVVSLTTRGLVVDSAAVFIIHRVNPVWLRKVYPSSDSLQWSPDVDERHGVGIGYDRFEASYLDHDDSPLIAGSSPEAPFLKGWTRLKPSYSKLNRPGYPSPQSRRFTQRIPSRIRHCSHIHVQLRTRCFLSHLGCRLVASSSVPASYLLLLKFGIHVYGHERKNFCTL